MQLGAACRDSFKSLREKYVREREKALQMAHTYKEWSLLQDLKFLDPNIVPRKQSVSLDDFPQNVDVLDHKTENPAADTNSTDLNRNLVALVRKASPIWDRSNSAYPNKQLKMKLWKEIADGLHKNVDVCMLRWKALREKYIRQKNRSLEDGTSRWELLEDMSFLDKVILYRRRSEHEYEPHSHPSYPENYDNSYDSSVNDSSNDHTAMVQIKEENSVQVPDSSITSYKIHARRASSDHTEEYPKKRAKLTPEQSASEITKSPEQLFGDLVAALLSKKREREKNIAMMDIMTILTK